MQKVPGDFSAEDVEKLAKSPLAQQLLSALRSTDSEALNKAQLQAQSGNYQQASKTLSALLKSSQVQQLIKEMKKQYE